MKFRKIVVFSAIALASMCGGTVSYAQQGNLPIQHQLDAISDALRSQKAISKNDVMTLFDIKGDGVAVGHEAYGKKPDGSGVTSTIYAFTGASISVATGLQRVEIEAIDDSSRVLRLHFYPQKGVCMRAGDFISRYGLKSGGTSEPTPGAIDVTYSVSFNGGNLYIYVPTSQKIDVACAVEVHVFANMP